MTDQACALIVTNLGGGDYALHYVDAARWVQIAELEHSDNYAEAVLGYCLDDRDDPDAVRPANLVGAVLSVVYVQRGVIEPAKFANIERVLFIEP